MGGAVGLASRRNRRRLPMKARAALRRAAPAPGRGRRVAAGSVPARGAQRGCSRPLTTGGPGRPPKHRWSRGTWRGSSRWRSCPGRPPTREETDRPRRTHRYPRDGHPSWRSEATWTDAKRSWPGTRPCRWTAAAPGTRRVPRRSREPCTGARGAGPARTGGWWPSLRLEPPTRVTWGRAGRRCRVSARGRWSSRRGGGWDGRRGAGGGSGGSN